MTRAIDSHTNQGSRVSTSGSVSGSTSSHRGQGESEMVAEKPATLHQNLEGTQANKGMLADEIARLLNTPRRNAARTLDSLLNAITNLLKAHGRVAVKGFGTFERKIRKGRAYKHPLSGESIEVPDKETILFKPSKNLIAASRSNRTNQDNVLHR